MQGYTPNSAMCIAMQADVTPSVVGGTGVGKSATLEALSAAINHRSFTFVAGTRGEEEATGIPSSVSDAYFSRKAPAWVRTINESPDPWMVVIDEATTAEPAMFKGLMALILPPHRVGDAVLKTGTKFVVVSNPPEMCPDGRDFPPTIVTRLCHLKWHSDNDVFLKGLEAGCNWQKPVVPVLPDNWKEFLPAAGSLIANFLRSNPPLIRLDTAKPERLMKAHPCDRTWDFAVRCYAAAMSLGWQDTGVCDELLDGCVGDGAASELREYLAKLDLPNIDELMADAYDNPRWKFPYEKSRVDRSIAIANGVVSKYISLRSSGKDDTATATAWLSMANIAAAMYEARADMIGIFTRALAPVPKGCDIPARLLSAQTSITEAMKKGGDARLDTKAKKGGGK